MTPEEFRKYGHQAIDWVAEFLTNVERYPVLPPVKPGELTDALPAHGPEKMGFEPTGAAFSGLCGYRLRHLDIVVGSAGVEPTSERGDRVQGYSLLPLPLGQLPKLK